ncbi:uncharacterized protein LOC119679229 isoform X2 [Teleopsis dalmanni]|uniref:uncharacterized protein LOC119679229 isoform X2 n=2 Tax=Teleopsis dalmanni TaxID=139649 RepID=UPI0018CCA9AF|nr:uncharacterized protein LOC119679229 isoform X2 [Teleopsis dalmanni]
MPKIFLICLLSVLLCASGQRITTIHLDGVQYFISRMNPYSPELNYFLAYQYCRSLGLQLASFETKEKAESMTTYLKNAGYGNYDFWTSGNRLGTGMFLWMSTGLPFNATFDFFENSADAIQAGLLDPTDHNSNTSPQRTARDSSGAEKGCVILKQPSLKWMPEDCSTVKDFICEQTRCYYYNYGSIPVSSAQGRPITSTTPRPIAPILTSQSSTTPLPALISTYSSLIKKTQDHAELQQQPSFISLRIDHEDSKDGINEEEHEFDDADLSDDDEQSETQNTQHVLDEHARELNDIKEHVMPMQTNELHRDEVQAIEDLHQQLQEDEHEYNKDSMLYAEINSDEHSSGEEVNDTNENNTETEEHENVSAPAKATSVSSTSEEPSVEVRLKQISQEIEKLNNKETPASLHPVGISHDNDDFSRQSFLSLTDLIRTLRPNDKQIIPQIDSDYSNAMRVLGETSALVNNDESHKKSGINGNDHYTRSLF